MEYNPTKLPCFFFSRVVKRNEFEPTVNTEDVKKFISEFFKDQDSDMELVFGPEFELPELLEPIKK